MDVIKYCEDNITWNKEFILFCSFRRGIYNCGGSMSNQPKQEVEQSHL